MSDLQIDPDKNYATKGSVLIEYRELKRRVANLDMEAATDIINRLRYIETGDEWDDKIDDIAAEAVNGALNITTEDDDG